MEKGEDKKDNEEKVNQEKENKTKKNQKLVVRGVRGERGKDAIYF